MILYFVRYLIGVEIAGKYKAVLCSDDELFGGMNRIDKNCEHFTFPEGYAGRKNYIQVRRLKKEHIFKKNKQVNKFCSFS